MRFHPTTLIAAFVAPLAAACGADATEPGSSSTPVVPCEVTHTCMPAAGGFGGVTQNTGGVTVPTGGSTSVGTGGVQVNTGGTLASGGAGPLTGGAPGTGGAGAGGAPEETPECDVPLDFRARKDTSGAKFPVPVGTIDLYQCFAFKVNLPGQVHALSFQPLIDNSKVVHHYLLYKMGVPQIDGLTSPCVGLHRDGVMVDGWAPGQSGVTLPKDVGMDIGTGDFMLELHYNNFGDSTEDSSGVRICATKNLRKNTATVSFLGTEAIIIPPAVKDFKVTSRCLPSYTAGPINVVRSWPHMHVLGSHMKADIVRAGGQTEVLFDKAFDFNSQLGYATPAVINPGDSIVTTCTWNNPGGFPVTFGEGTTAEMCYNFTVAYPAYSLQSIGLHSTSCNN
jgi:hypothetical protein